MRQSRTTQAQVRTRERADQRFHALETMPTSEPAYHRPYLLEDKLTSEGAGETMPTRRDKRGLSQVRGPAYRGGHI